MDVTTHIKPDKPELKVPRTETGADIPNRQITQSPNLQIAMSSLDPLVRATLLPSLLALLRTFLFSFPVAPCRYPQSPNHQIAKSANRHVLPIPHRS